MRLLGWTGSSVGGTCGLARLTTGQVCFNSPCKGLEVSHFVQTSLLLFGQIISAVAVMTQRYLLAALPKRALAEAASAPSRPPQRLRVSAAGSGALRLHNRELQDH